ncbi:hypothetical protein NKH77_49765 [Streptomyces sp. M19]
MEEYNKQLKEQGRSQMKIMVLPTNQDAMLAVKSGRADAFDTSTRARRPPCARPRASASPPPSRTRRRSASRSARATPRPRAPSRRPWTCS